MASVFLFLTRPINRTRHARAQMRLEQHEIGHLKAALGAPVHPVERMPRPPVHRRRRRVGERLGAQAAAVRPGARVNGHMIAQALQRQKGAAAVFAGERAMLQMGAYVLVQDKLAREAAATDVARVAIVFDVGGHVFAEQAALQEGGRAVAAFERSAKRQRGRERESGLE